MARFNYNLLITFYGLLEALSLLENNADDNDDYIKLKMKKASLLDMIKLLSRIKNKLTFI